jgi:hypothetical protein
MSQYTEQAEKFMKDTKTTMKAVLADHAPYFDDDKNVWDIWRVTLRRHGKSFSFRFGQSIATLGQDLTPYDVLACLTKYDPGTFENFCGDFGYDTDSKKAEKTYKAVVKEWQGVKRLFGDVLERLSELQ